MRLFDSELLRPQTIECALFSLPPSSPILPRRNTAPSCPTDASLLRLLITTRRTVHPFFHGTSHVTDMILRPSPPLLQPCIPGGISHRRRSLTRLLTGQPHSHHPEHLQALAHVLSFITTRGETTPTSWATQTHGPAFFATFPCVAQLLLEFF
jgi:hypothetical protein